VVDTTGAGDAYLGALAAYIAHGSPILEAMEMAGQVTSNTENPQHHRLSLSCGYGRSCALSSIHPSIHPSNRQTDRQTDRQTGRQTDTRRMMMGGIFFNTGCLDTAGCDCVCWFRGCTDVVSKGR